MNGLKSTIIFTFSLPPLLKGLALKGISQRGNSISSLFSSRPLIPEENPLAFRDQISKSGVPYTSVLEGLHQLYPPSDLSRRNAASRTDGYWPFIRNGQDPPQQLTYGEFDFYFFAELIDKAQDFYFEGREDIQPTWQDKVFCDVGSGAGRLVLAAAALHPGWKLCHGIELLHSIHVLAEEALDMCNPISETKERRSLQPLKSSFVGEEDILLQSSGKYILNGENGDGVNGESIVTLGKADSSLDHFYLPTSHESLERAYPLAPVKFTCGSFDDPSTYFGDSDCIFVFSSCMSKAIITRLSQAIAKQCKPGTIVITTEFHLELHGMVDPSYDPDEEKYSHCNYDGDFDDPDDAEEWKIFCADEGIELKPFQFDLLEKKDGYCWLTGGTSTAYIHRVVKSSWEEGRKPFDVSTLSDEEAAAMAWIHAIKYPSSDFYREVRNNMIFHGFDELWYKDLEG